MKLWQRKPRPPRPPRAPVPEPWRPPPLGYYRGLGPNGEAVPTPTDIPPWLLARLGPRREGNLVHGRCPSCYEEVTLTVPRDHPRWSDRDDPPVRASRRDA